MFLSTDFAFRITDWTCCHGPHLHAILRIISRGVSGLATDSPCGVWGRGWTTCLLHDSPLFGSHFKMRVPWYFVDTIFIDIRFHWTTTQYSMEHGTFESPNQMSPSFMKFHGTCWLLIKMKSGFGIFYRSPWNFGVPWNSTKLSWLHFI